MGLEAPQQQPHRVVVPVVVDKESLDGEGLDRVEPDKADKVGLMDKADKVGLLAEECNWEDNWKSSQ